MSERYTRVFTLTEDLYSIGSPVIIRAGALLKDNINGMVLAQLKFENIGSKEIIALTVAVQPLDVKGSPLGEVVSHQYLDLNQKRNSQFGSKEAVFIPNTMTRSFTVTVTEVVFSDSTYCTYSSAEWKPLEKCVPLSPAWEGELIKQYHLENGYKGEYFYKEVEDLWYCSCGAVNHSEETNCHECGTPRNTLRNLDVAGLKARMSQRLEEERKAEEERLRVEEEKKRIAEQERIEAEKIEDRKRKKRKKIIKIISAVIIPIVLIPILVFASSNIIGYHYAKQGNYEMVPKFVFAPEVTRLFDENLAEYSIASEFLVQKKYDDALEKFEKIKNYCDSDEIVNMLLVKDNFIAIEQSFFSEPSSSQFKTSRVFLKNKNLIKKQLSILQEASENSAHSGLLRILEEQLDIIHHYERASAPDTAAYQLKYWNAEMEKLKMLLEVQESLHFFSEEFSENIKQKLAEIEENYEIIKLIDDDLRAQLSEKSFSRDSENACIHITLENNTGINYILNFIPVYYLDGIPMENYFSYRQIEINSDYNGSIDLKYVDEWEKCEIRYEILLK